MRVVDQPDNVAEGVFDLGNDNAPAHFLRRFVLSGADIQPLGITAFHIVYTPVGHHALLLVRCVLLRLQTQLVPAYIETYVKWLVKLRLGIKGFGIPFCCGTQVAYLVNGGAEAKDAVFHDVEFKRARALVFRIS